MLYFYDGQIRRYLLQISRLLSNFVVRYGDGTLNRVPVMYGDQDRQVANIINQNSENSLQSAPKIAIYVSDLQLDRNRMGDSSFVGKMHIRERDFDDVNNEYLQQQGGSYTIERLMPTPFKLTVKADIWSTSTDQKLQILEQLLVLFNPSLEIQTTDNFVDWTSLSVVDLTNVIFSSRSVPTGTNTAIDIATLSLETPIWLTPPAKVKKLGVVTNIISSIFGNIGNPTADYMTGLGSDPNNGFPDISDKLFTHKSTNGNFDIIVIDGCITVVEPTNSTSIVNWNVVFDQAVGAEKYRPSLSKIYLLQQDGTEVVGYITLDPFDETCLSVNWDEDTYPANTGIDSWGVLEDEPGYNVVGSFRQSPPGLSNFDAIIDPQKTGPRGSGLPNAETGQRYLLVDDIGAVGNDDGADAWKSDNNDDLIAHANDIIEWQEDHWEVIFNSQAANDKLICQTNLKTLVQYKWDGISWSKSFEGEYKRGDWRLVL
jgi:hypothetical protein